MRKIIKSKKNKIYSPLYRQGYVPSGTTPNIYNYEGKKMDVYFFRDIHTAHDPYGGNGKYFIWDRYNFGLKTHFYSHKAMLETMGAPIRKYGILCETPEIVPDDYKIFKRNKGLENEFSAIFTYSQDLLNEIANAKFFPGCAGVWYGRNDVGIMDWEQYKKKNKNISMVSSDKRICKMHKLRYNLAVLCKKEGIAETFGTFDGGHFVPIERSLKDYRYSIVIENTLEDYFFSERITSCFAAQTIPIYLGAEKIEDFFNIDGIIKIQLKDLDNIDLITKVCTKEEYERRIPFILDNFNRVQKYINMQDYLYETYLQEDICNIEK